MANVGLLYFLFLVGVEMDIMVVRKTGKRALTIDIGGMVLPFLIGAAFSFSMHRSEDHLGQGTYILFLGVALSVTAFPVLARILAELKLINTEIGRIYMSAALVNDMFAWILLALAIALAESDKTSFASLSVMISSAVLSLFASLL
ncbi:Cation/H(+) antiporter 15 [Cardamine amara subsp. amara]|uniref:Cation/H(+) antiporter 15 n=1 Tax=Cardamine amara subsp. amara TaxID=228776 RepID=A0ABD1C5W0_CARAN